MPTTSVIIPAAGAGKRFGGSVKKPFAQIDGRPVFLRSIELFINRDDVSEVLLSVAPSDYDVVKEKFAANLMFMGIKLVKGGQERYESVRAALEQVDSKSDLVCVHDAVRPCVLNSWIDEVFKRAAERGAAILAAPVSATLKRASGGDIQETVPREALYEAQTPQVFRADWLREAYAALPADFQPTDDAQVVERMGHPIAVVEADRRNIKITTPGDMALATSILKDFASQGRKARPRNPFEEAQW